MDNQWSIPNFETFEFSQKKSDLCVCIPVINEGGKLKEQLNRMKSITKEFDVIIADGGSVDGSTDPDFLRAVGVRTLLVKKDNGKLSAQLRMGFSYSILQGYDGVITVDGNNKDSVESVKDFAMALRDGYDFVQGSRFIPDGHAINTPLIRLLAIRLIHAPIISLLAGFRFTDTTNGFRGMSKKLLSDKNLDIFRDVFQTYELLAYLSVKSFKHGFHVKEIPVTRVYPKKGKTPTKISPIRGNILLLKILWKLANGEYDT